VKIARKNASLRGRNTTFKNLNQGNSFRRSLNSLSISTRPVRRRVAAVLLALPAHAVEAAAGAAQTSAPQAEKDKEADAHQRRDEPRLKAAVEVERVGIVAVLHLGALAVRHAVAAARELVRDAVHHLVELVRHVALRHAVRRAAAGQEEDDGDGDKGEDVLHRESHLVRS
jgi:hypothetical protein